MYYVSCVAISKHLYLETALTCSDSEKMGWWVVKQKPMVRLKIYYLNFNSISPNRNTEPPNYKNIKTADFSIFVLAGEYFCNFTQPITIFHNYSSFRWAHKFHFW